MDEKKNGGAAFPTSHSPDYPNEIIGGMSLRDYFAGQALQGMSAGQWLDPGDYPEVARRCYAKADAMLAERAK